LRTLPSIRSSRESSKSKCDRFGRAHGAKEREKLSFFIVLSIIIIIDSIFAVSLPWSKEDFLLIFIEFPTPKENQISSRTREDFSSPANQFC
jgi:hypothetical protein